MSMTLSVADSDTVPRWREVVWPREHGSWSLALEPIALGLLVAPSGAGIALSVAIVAGFFARRPLRIATSDSKPERRAVARRALGVCALIAACGVIATMVLAGGKWVPWLLPTVVAGAAFVHFDLHRSGREQYAELAGSLAFAWLPAVIVILASASWQLAVAVAAVMLARTVPTVLTVRATVRARKAQVRPARWPAVVALAAAAGVTFAATSGWVPWVAAALSILLALRSLALLVFPRPALRASTIGMIEAALGALYVLTIGVAWH